MIVRSSSCVDVYSVYGLSVAPYQIEDKKDDKEHAEDNQNN
jgi:hypothetical protein